MKSFKATRMTLAIAVALCMLLSAVSVSATEAGVSAQLGERLNDGWYSATVTVSGIAEGDATVMVYEKDSAVTKDTVVFVDQHTSADGSTEWAIEIPHGEYTVVGGGTGLSSASATLVANTAPSFAQATYAEGILDNAAAGDVVAAIAATDVDGDAIAYTLTGSEKFALNAEDEIVVADGASFAAGDSYTLTLTAGDGYATAGATVTVSVAASTVYYNVESVAALADIWVRANETEVDLPETVQLTYNNDQTVDASVVWGEPVLPTVVGSDTVVTGTITLPAIGEGYALTNTDNLTASVTLKLVDESLAVTVNGVAANDTYYIATGASAEIAVAYGNAGAGTEYAYVASDVATVPSTPVEGWTSEAAYTFADSETPGVVYITVFVNDDGNYYYKQAVVEVTDALYTAAVYVNATEANPTYSAYRVNSKGGMVLTSALANMNGDAVVGTVEYAICEAGGSALLSNNDGIFAAEDLAKLPQNTEYWVRVALTVDEEKVAYAGKFIYLAGYSVSYTSHVIDGHLNGSGIAVNKNKDLNFSITFDEGDADSNEIYASYALAKYDDAEDIIKSGDATKTTGLVYSDAISGLGSAESGAYNLYWFAKKTADQTYFDRTVAKSVYLYSKIALINNIYLNGSMNCALGNPASLTLKAHWLGDEGEGAYYESIAPELTYVYEIYKSGSDLTLDNLVYTSDEVKNNAVVTIDDLSSIELGFENTVRVSVYRDGVLDTVFEKIFYPTIGA